MNRKRHRLFPHPSPVQFRQNGKPKPATRSNATAPPMPAQEFAENEESYQLA